MLILIILTCLVISLISLMGVVVLYFKHKITPDYLCVLISFAAGVMLATAFLNILPEAIEKAFNQWVFVLALSGMVFGFLMERFFLWYHHHHEETHDLHPSVLLILFGDGLHNFIDGLSIAAAFLINPVLGLTTAIAIAVHEIPQELADYTVLIHQGMKKSKAVWLNFISALVAVIGGVFGYYFFSIAQSYVPYVLAITAGIFIYIAGADLIPELHSSKTKKSKLSQTFPFLLGIGLILLINQFFPH